METSKIDIDKDLFSLSLDGRGLALWSKVCYSTGQRWGWTKTIWSLFGPPLPLSCEKIRGSGPARGISPKL
jgi:hypothetical protein